MWSTSTSVQQSTAIGCFLASLSVPVINLPFSQNYIIAKQGYINVIPNFCNRIIQIIYIYWRRWRDPVQIRQNSVFILLYIHIHYPLVAFTNWIYFHLTSAVIKTQSQLSVASWDEGNPNCSRLTLCFPEPTVTLAAEDRSNYAAFSSTVLLGFFPF